MLQPPPWWRMLHKTSNIAFEKVDKKKSVPAVSDMSL
jgi:hypothetical protein